MKKAWLALVDIVVILFVFYFLDGISNIINVELTNWFALQQMQGSDTLFHTYKFLISCVELFKNILLVGIIVGIIAISLKVEKKGE